MIIFQLRIYHLGEGFPGISIPNFTWQYSHSGWTGLGSGMAAETVLLEANFGFLKHW